MNNLSNSLESKLKTYSLIGLGGVLAAGLQANGAVQVTNNVDHVITGTGTFNIDFEGTDGDDLQFKRDGGFGGVVYISTIGSAQFRGNADGQYFYPKALNNTANLNATNTDWGKGAGGASFNTLAIRSYPGAGTHWKGQTNKYLGVRFKIGADFHYGWVKISVANDVSSATIHAYAYEDQPYTGISAPLPVELTTFEALLGESNVQLKWETATEVNNFGFEVERSIVSEKDEQWESIGFVQGHGTTNSPKQYLFADSDLPDATEVKYRLKQIDNDGDIHYSKSLTVDISTLTDLDDLDKPLEFSLQQNFPNPFNPSTTIRFSLPESGNVTLKLYSATGEEVSTLIKTELVEGEHQFNFNGEKLASGFYSYRIDLNGKFTSTKKMLLIK